MRCASWGHAPALSRTALHSLHDAGVRGVRLNLETVGQSDPAIATRLLREAAEMVAPLGWHVQVYTSMAVLAAAHAALRDLPAPLVVDHFGRAMAAAGPAQPGFDALLDLVSTGRAYVKLSAAHRIAPGAPDDAEPIALALIAANSARMLWGSDWPHPGGQPGTRRDRLAIEPFNPIDDGAALNRLRRWAGTDDVLRAILVDNPARLYDFP
jgi:predicted TIM-barrel fold metal-dependent hydrolase